MKKDDQRKYNDNSRDWNNNMIEKREKALITICNLILKKNEPQTFANVAFLLSKKYDKNIAISAQTISQTQRYRKIYHSIFNKNKHAVKKRKSDPRSTAELQHALYKQQMRNRELARDIKILRHHIQQSDLTVPNNEYNIEKSNLTPEYRDIIKLLLEALINTGEYYWEGDILKKEFDNSIMLNKKILITLGMPDDKTL